MKTVPLGEIAQLGSGGTPKRSVDEYFGPGTPWMSIADLNDGTVYGAKESLTDSGLANSSAKVVTPGTILLAMYGSIGKLAIAGVPLCTSQAIAFIRPDPRKVDRDFLFHYLRAQRPHLQANGRGGTQMNISQGDLKKWPVPLPPLDEQRRIAAILDQADDIRTKQRNVATHFAGLAEAIFLDMFGDPDEALLSGAVVRFGEVADLQGGRNLVADDQDTVSEFRVLKISAVTSGKFKPSESKALPAGYIPPADHFVRQGDLLISRANTSDLVGAVAYVEETPSNLVLPDKVWRFVWRNPDSDPLYYRSLFRTTSVRRRISQLASGTGGSMKNISKAKLVELELPAVTFAQQREFARRVGAIPRPAYTEIDALMSSLQSRAFAGQL